MSVVPVPQPSPFLAAIRSQLVNANGMATWIFERLLQDWDTRLTNGLNAIGQFVGSINPATIISDRPTTTIGTLLHNMDDDGVLLGPGADFARAYLNKDTDNITDGTGSPLAGGKVAYAAMVAAGPALGEILVYDGTHFLPHPKANTKAPISNQFLQSYDDATGNFTQAQPALSGLSGTINPGTQLPASGVTPGSYTLASLTVSAEGLVSAAANGPAGLSVTIVTAQLTTLGTQGSMTFVSGVLTAQTPAT